MQGALNIALIVTPMQEMVHIMPRVIAAAQKSLKHHRQRIVDIDCLGLAMLVKLKIT